MGVSSNSQTGPVAWMTEDGRVVNAHSKATCGNSSLDTFTIPLYLSPVDTESLRGLLREWRARHSDWGAPNDLEQRTDAAVGNTPFDKSVPL